MGRGKKGAAQSDRLVAASRGGTKTKKKPLKTAMKKDKTLALQVVIERTHQDDLSWGAYVQIEPVITDKAFVPYDPSKNVYLVEVSWTGPKLKTPHLVDPINKGGGKKALEFLLAGPGYPGSKVLVRLRFSPGVSFDELVTVKGWRLHDKQELVGDAKWVHHVPLMSNFP